MGGEFGQWEEWYHERSLDWHLLEYPHHQEVQRWVKDLNRLYRTEPALHGLDFLKEGLEWVDFRDWEGSIISFLRKGKGTDDIILVVCNFTPIPRKNYRVGVPRSGFWKEVLNSDSMIYGGSGQGNFGGVEAAPVPSYRWESSLSLILPPLGVLFFKSEGSGR